MTQKLLCQLLIEQIIDFEMTIVNASGIYSHELNLHGLNGKC